MFVHFQPLRMMAIGIREIFVKVLPVILVVASCAKINSPSGGPKDKEPPVIIKSEPLNGQTNFRDKKITVTFNEFVALDKITEKFMVSPPMKGKPDITIKGKSIVISYDEELADSTTYTFYFQDAIRDLNENNPIENYQFVISTGDVIDSLSVTGNVQNAYTLDPPENVLVLLYRNLEDTAVQKVFPDYISRADKFGYFRIDNVRAGRYRLYALTDADNSKTFNLQDEDFAFGDSVITVTPETNWLPVKPDTLTVKLPGKARPDTIIRKGEHQLFMFKHAKKTRYLTSSARNMKYRLSYTLSLPPDTSDFGFSIDGADEKSFFIEKSFGRDTIIVWLTDSTIYSQPQLTTLISYPFTDTLGKTIIKHDTVLQRFIIPRATRARQKPAPFKVSSSLTSGSIKPGKEIIFRSATPFRDPDLRRINLFETKDSVRIPVTWVIERDSMNSCRLVLKSDFKPGKSYLLITDSASFGDIYGENSDSSGIKFNVRNENSFGRLNLNITNFEGKRIVQLLTDQEKPVQENRAEGNGKIEFLYIDKGKYRLKVIYDINGDGKWTPGDFQEGVQPEPVSFYDREIDVGENFWIDQDWDTGKKNHKKMIKKPGKSPGR